MKRALFLSGLIIAVLLQSCSLDKLYQKGQRYKNSSYEQIGFKDIIGRYMMKEGDAPFEGIYSVSVSIVKKSKGLLSSVEREKTVERKDNYCKVAVIRDPGNRNREYFEVSMDKEYVSSLSIIGEFSHTSDGNLLVYKHIESKGRTSSYTFTYDKTTDILEGVRTENNGSASYTYKLTYLKIAPRAPTRSSGTN